MKRNFIGIILGSLALMLGVTSCKKDCTECMRYSYTYQGGGSLTYYICQDDGDYTQEEWDVAVAYYTANFANNPDANFEIYEDCE